MTTTNIQWAQHVWNPVVGCSIASHGCNNCYAMGMAHRIQAMAEGSGKSTHYAGLTHKASRPGAKAVWTGQVASAPDAIWLQPLRRKKPTRYFVNSMGDLFHPDVPDEWRDRAFAVMALAQQHTFMVLTKRPDLMRDYVARFNNGDWIGNLLDLMDELQCNTARNGRYICHGSSAFTGWPLPNVWLGVSTEDQAQADARIPPLLATPAAKRFISAEPLLGPISLAHIKHPTMQGAFIDALDGYTWHVDGAIAIEGTQQPALDWVICGGESGPNARPMHPDWARSLRDQCAQAGVPFFFKQWGEWLPSVSEDDGWRLYSFPDDGSERSDIIPEGAKRPNTRLGSQEFWRVGTKRAGNMLDGRQHLEMPK